MRDRREKLERLRASGVDPYSRGFMPTNTTEGAKALLGDAERSRPVALAGRLMVKRLQGGLVFAVLQEIPGGGHARPFQTHHNSLDRDLYLRIALELHLKRLLVGGFERVYEIGRVFRNEGLSPRHNPEFTLLESYQAYADYEDVMQLVEDLIMVSAMAAGRPLDTSYQGEAVNLTPPYRRERMADLVLEYTGRRAAGEEA